MPFGKTTTDLLDTFVMEEIKAKGDLAYAGYILSNAGTSSFMDGALILRNYQKKSKTE